MSQIVLCFGSKRSPDERKWNQGITTSIALALQKEWRAAMFAEVRAFIPELATFKVACREFIVRMTAMSPFFLHHGPEP
ncbi:MAG: hypothetical protein ACLQHK_11065 [Gallionellaceae bacterium]